jgi:uncharacterized protein (DUF305 family)
MPAAFNEKGGLLTFLHGRGPFFAARPQIRPIARLSKQAEFHAGKSLVLRLFPTGTNDVRSASRRMPFSRHTAASVVFLLLTFGIAPVSPIAAGRQTGDPAPRPDLVRQPYSDADVEFMAGMIPHHAQALLIAGWAASHGARADVRALCERIVVGQRDEIETMRNWLRDRGQTVPDANATHHRMKMNGVEHDMLMPGMLTPEELARLDKARGPEWDRLFLEAMIHHHQGALKMVDDLYGAHGALQDEDLFKFVSDLYADQTIEIERMQKMLGTEWRGVGGVKE